MTALTRWNPFEEMEAMQNRLSSFFNWHPVRGNEYESSAETEWSPLVDVIETADEYLIRADLPGVSKSDVSVTLENDELVVQGSRPHASDPEGARYLNTELAYGRFSRVIQLPAGADSDRIRATFKDGVLTVRLPKQEQAKPRQIKISNE